MLKPTRWTLQDLMTAPQGEPVETAYAELAAATDALEAMRPDLTDELSVDGFTTLLTAMERFARSAGRLGAYGSLWFAEDTQSQEALGFMGRADEAVTEAQNRVLFIQLWWRNVPDETAERLLPHSGDMRYYFEQQRLLRDHTLSEETEQVINLKDVNGINAMVTLYDMITNKFVFRLEVEEEMKELTRGELMTYVRHPSSEVRHTAYEELNRVYAEESSVLGQIYIHRVRDWASEQLKLRHYSSPIGVRNQVNDLPDAVVDTLLEVCAEQAPVFQRYFQLKAGWLGVDKLHRRDLYAPLTSESAQKIPYHEAVTMVLDSFESFSPEIARQARRIFDENHIDSEIRKGKRSGAFCASVSPELTPWVLMNYDEDPRDVATLAHEMGHAVHAMLAEHHSPFTFHSALPMAETASVFSELLLTDRLLNETSDPQTRRNLLASVVDDSYATVLRQAYFVRFERTAHEMIQQGATLDALKAAYLENLNQQFGDALTISEDFQYEWVCIPHIYHVPFYCYAYSFGQLLSLALYQQYQTEGAAFTPKLTKILAYGGSASPNHILTEVGINMADPDFWRGGFQVVEGFINLLKEA